MTGTRGRSENVTAVLLMTLAMGMFATADALIKVVSGAISPGQIIFLMGIGGTYAFGCMIRRNRERFFPREAFGRIPVLRLSGEVVGAIGFVSALTLGNLAIVSSVLQAAPLAVIAGAALFLGETVGIRRWLAVLVGFAGVLLIIQPCMEGFNFATVLAFVGMLGLSTRDLATRGAPKSLSNRQLAFHGFTVLIPTGLVMMKATTGWQNMSATEWLTMVGVIAFAVGAYYAVTAAMRLGEISFVTPFRYSRIVFAILFGYFAFAEPIDSLSALGICIVIASGLYSMWRENRHRR